jgi:hypothetical protein
MESLHGPSYRERDLRQCSHRELHFANGATRPAILFCPDDVWAELQVIDLDPIFGKAIGDE